MADQSVVTRVMVYDLAPVMNTERVFNYMCLYGNVHRVQFYNKPSLSCLGKSHSFQFLHACRAYSALYNGTSFVEIGRFSTDL